MASQSSSRERIARHRSAQRARGLRPVVVWLPDIHDAAYRLKLAEACRSLAVVTDEEAALAADYARLANQTEGWR